MWWWWYCTVSHVAVVEQKNKKDEMKRQGCLCPLLSALSPHSPQPYMSKGHDHHRAFRPSNNRCSSALRADARRLLILPRTMTRFLMCECSTGRATSQTDVQEETVRPTSENASPPSIHLASAIRKPPSRAVKLVWRQVCMYVCIYVCTVERGSDMDMDMDMNMNMNMRDRG